MPATFADLNNSAIPRFPDERVLIAIDAARGKKLFPDFRDMDVNNELRVLKMLAYMPDVDVVLPGHGPIVTQGVFMDSHRYISAMKQSVLELMAEGRPLQEIKLHVAAQVRDEFSDYTMMDAYLIPNIVSMYDYLFRYREPNISIKPGSPQDRRNTRFRSPRFLCCPLLMLSPVLRMLTAHQPTRIADTIVSVSPA